MNSNSKIPREPAPIERGERIPGTHLIRQFQAGREVVPVFEIADPALLEEACQEAEAHGYKSFALDARTYVRFGSIWYSGCHPAFSADRN